MNTTPEMEKLFYKLDILTDAIFALASAQTKETEASSTDWLDSSAFISKAGIRDRSSLSYYVQKGVFDNAAMKNIGTIKKPRYRFHRLFAIEQFLNNSTHRKKTNV